MIVFAWGSLAGCTLTRAPAPDRPRAGASTTIYVARRKWHIDVGFATADLGPLTFASTQFSGSKYVFFGFGDRHYLLARNHDAPVLSGALWPGAGLILVTALQGAPQAAFGGSQVVEIQLSQAQARALQSFIRASIADSAANVPIPNASAPYAPARLAPAPLAPGPLAPGPLAKGPYEDSLYYAASARYSGFHTCNTWAAEALRAGDLPIRARGVLFAGQLWSQVRRLGASSSPSPAVPQSP
jgi:hypothetical protein